MTLYTIHNLRDSTSRPTLIGHRFCWSAFVFGPFWLLSRGRWISAAFMLLFEIGGMIAANLGFLSPAAALLAFFVASILLGLEASELDRRSAARRGKHVLAVASGSSAPDALANMASAVSHEEASR